MRAVVAPNLVLSAPPAWDRLARATFRVRQHYSYSYPSPIRDLRQQLIMLPPETHGAQRLLERELRVDGAVDAHVLSQPDRFGNVVYHVTSPSVRTSVEFTADFTVERYATSVPLRVPDDANTRVYRTQTSLTAPCNKIRSAARALSAEIHETAVDMLAAEILPDGIGCLDGDDVRQWALAQCGAAWAAHAITYQFGVTGVQTPAAMALHLGRGVCQDFAHIAIAILRELHVPTRYVSGHLLGEGAPHAWIETLLPDPDVRGQLRVVAYDPTHGTTPGLDYVTVAVGRDYSDIAPTSGTFHGASGHFTARKQSWLVALA